MRNPNDRIYELAKLAMSTTNNDIARAVTLLSEWTGLSAEFAFEAVDAVMIDHVAAQQFSMAGEDLAAEAAAEIGYDLDAD